MRNKKLNVLVSVYAVSPSWGSEPGMGWNWIINLAKYCNLFVITEGRDWHDEILAEVENLPQKENLHFYFSPVSSKVREMCKNQGDWRFYWYYRKWQKKTLKIAKQIIAENHIDVMHQLNMIGFREPGYLWKIKDIPLVWGPVGGMANIPTAYLKGAGWKMNVFCRLKNRINNVQFRFHPRVRAAVKHSYMIGAMKEVQEATQKVYGIDIPVINETGTYISDLPQDIHNMNCDNFKILWVGKFDFRKQFELALKSVARMKNKKRMEFHVIAPLNDVKRKEIEFHASNLGLSDHLFLHGRVPNADVHQMMKNSDVLLFTSLAEGTPHVVLEAIKNNLPIVCFDICGQGEVVDETIGFKIKPSNPKDSIMQFSMILDELCKNEELGKRLTLNCNSKQLECSWDAKIKTVVNLYYKIAKQ